VALKLLPAHLAAEPSLRERFLREARTAARLSQPNIVPIHTVDQVESFVFFTMAYVEGESLGASVRRRGALPAAETARILREVAWALAYAHAQGVVHRDVKPDNILLEVGSGRALVTDFGIAQVRATPGLTGRDEVLGTAEFMSPEQASGEPVDERSDIYSLGVVAYYTLTGRLPFEGESVAAILARQITQPAPPVASVAPEVPRHLARAVDRCLAKNPHERFANGEELADALGRSLAVRREIRLPLRVFITQNREQFRGLALWGVFLGWTSLVSVLMVLENEPIAAAIAAFTALAIGSAPPGMLLRLVRQLLRSGYCHRELLLALKDDLQARRDELSFERHAERTWVDRLGSSLWYGGLGATALGTALAFVLDLNAIPGLAAAAIAALAGGGFIATFVGLPITAARGRHQPGIADTRWARFWDSRVGKWLFRLGGVGLKELPAPTTGYRPTEMAIGMAAERLFEELPQATRKQLTGLPEVVRRLEHDAREMRQRLTELDGLLSDVEPASRGSVASGPDVARGRVAEDLARAREAAQGRLQKAVASLEAIRLGLLRLHAGTGVVEGVTQDLTNAAEIAVELERLLAGREEVERSLRVTPQP
jgi:serine/threonine-protein kinase